MKDHVVAPGECIQSIAHDHRFAWKTLWDHPKNAELKEKRVDPFTLAPGDVVHISDPDPVSFTRATGKEHRFQLKDSVSALSLTLLDHDGKSRADVAYEIEIEGARIPGLHRTDGQGRIRHEISPKAKRGKLRIAARAGQPEEAFELMLGALDPIAETSGKLQGVQGRLAALGFYQGPIDDDASPATIYALQRFQKSRKLAPTGKLDDKTRDELKKAYGG